MFDEKELKTALYLYSKYYFFKQYLIMKTKFLFLIIPLFTFSLISKAQRTPVWVKKTEQTDITQGIIAKEVSTSLEIVSFYSFLAPYDINKNQDLHFSFTAPRVDSLFFLKAEEIKNFNYYRLESKPGVIAKGKQTIGPIPTNNYLGYYKIRPSNFAAILKFGGVQSNYLLPLIIYTDTIPDSIKTHKAIFRLSNSISKGKFSVFKGEFEKNIIMGLEPVQSGRIAGKAGGSNFSINISEINLGNYEGWFTVIIELSKRNSIEKISDRFLFYHYPSTTK